MKIYILPKTGIQEAEKYAVGRIEKVFPKEWRGYASLEVIERGTREVVRREEISKVDFGASKRSQFTSSVVKSWEEE